MALEDFRMGRGHAALVAVGAVHKYGRPHPRAGQTWRLYIQCQ